MRSPSEIRPGKPLLRRLRRGAQAIEFALLLPVLMAVTSAIVDYGWFFSQDLSVIAAVREGARAGAMANPDTTDWCAAASSRVRTSLSAAGLDASTATITTATSGVTPDQMITVSASVRFTRLMGLLPAPPVMKSTTTMRLESQDDTIRCSS